ncbi:MAG: hypothetical protein LBT51_02320 [Fusobacteriaceae bacterium]|nr:hypothetical protein [Fusobacteriaceae bacterium]
MKNNYNNNNEYNPKIYYHRSIRLKGYDYSKKGLYFVTIRTQNLGVACNASTDNIHPFGEIANGKMILSNIGIIANVFWYEIKNHTNNIALHEFIVMPNHIHGIIEIINNIAPPTVEALHATPLHIPTKQQTNAIYPKNEYMASISPKSRTLSTFIRSYKSAVSKHAHRLGFEFAWQRNYYEIIISNDKSYQAISNYIANNPINWVNYKFF